MSEPEIAEAFRSIRVEIDVVDAAIVQVVQAVAMLLQRRAEAVKRLGRIKMDQRLPLRDLEREAQVLENARRAAGYGPLSPDAIDRIFRSVIEESIRLQHAEVLL